MKLKKFLIFILLFILSPLNFSNAQNLSSKLKGKILLQVEDMGQAWYINPETEERAYLGRPADAFRIMRELGLGIKHEELEKYLNSSFPERLSGKILLDVEQNGEAYYVNPEDLKGYFLNRPDDAFNIMRKKGLGISDDNLWEIPLSKKYPDESGTNNSQDYTDNNIKEDKEKVANIKQSEGSNQKNEDQVETKNNDNDNSEKILNFKNYLKKIEQELALLESEYNKLASNINSENNSYKQEYENNIQSANNEYQENINYYKPTHDYWADYYQHKIDLEIGMGVRADKERIKNYQNRLDLENTNYNNLVVRLQNDRNKKKTQYKENYDNQIADTEQRLKTITEAYNNAKTEREILKENVLNEIELLKK
jgi:hypothetical protein